MNTRKNTARRKPLSTLIGSMMLGLALVIPVAVMAAPDSAAKYYEDALARYEKNDMPGAVIQLKNALQQDRKMLAAHLLLGKALLRNGDLKGAEAAFEEAIKQGVSRSEVVLPLGQVYLALGRPEAVIERIPADGLPTPLRVEVLTLRGNAYVEAGNTRLAAQSFDEARTLDPKSPSPLVAEVPMLITSGQLDKALEKAGKAVELAPENAYAWNMKASVLHARFDMAGALAAYDKALTLQLKHLDARVARAALLIDLKREAEAKKDLDYLLDTGADDPRAAYLRAVLAGQRGDAQAVNAALAEVTKTIDALPPSWLARREQLLMTGALAHHGLGNAQKAREYLDVLIARNGRNLGARKLLASIHVDTRDYGRALPLLESLYKIAPEDPQIMFLLGSVHMAQRRFVQATDLLEKAAARTGSAEMNRTLGFSQLGLGRNEIGQASLEKAFTANPGDTRAGMALAMLYIRQGKTPKALQTAEAMLKRDPANLTTLNFVGTIKGATGDLAGARTAYTQALAKDAAFLPSALNLVRLDLAERKVDEARRQLDGLLAKRHDNPDVLYEYGLFERRAGRMVEAVRHLGKAMDVSRKDARPALALIDLHLAQRQTDQALAVAKALASRIPDSLPVQLALARVHLASGDAAGARSVLSGATRLAEYDAGIQSVIARLQIAAGNNDGAAYSVQKALQGNPDDPAALALNVEVEARSGNAAKADAALKALTQKYPNRPETARVTAELALSRGQTAAAIAAYKTLLSREATSANALALARAHLAANETAKATNFLEGWVKSHPDDRVLRKALAETQFRAGQWQAARETYQRVVEVEPDDAASLNNYANLLQQLNDPAAQAQAEKAQKLAPENPAYADTLGWILAQKGQLEAGLRYLREARLRAPESGEIRFHLAWALNRIGRMAEAKDELKAALSGVQKPAPGEALTQLKQELGL